MWPLWAGAGFCPCPSVSWLAVSFQSAQTCEPITPGMLTSSYTEWGQRALKLTIDHPNPAQSIPTHPQLAFNSNDCHLTQPTGNSSASDSPQLWVSPGGVCRSWAAEITRWWHDHNWLLHWEVPSFPGTGLESSVISSALIKTCLVLVVFLWGAIKMTELPDTRAQVKTLNLRQAEFGQ